MVYILFKTEIEQVVHRDREVVTLMNFSSLTALKVVMMTTCSAVSDEKVIKMPTLSFLCSNPSPVKTGSCLFWSVITMAIDDLVM